MMACEEDRMVNTVVVLLGAIGTHQMASPDTGPPERSHLSGWWLPTGGYGAPAALQSVGSVAAPLLAGFSFTLVGLVLTSPERIRWPDASLVLFTAAGLCLVTAVQCAAWARKWDPTPTELLNWWPDIEKLPEGAREQVYEEQRIHALRHARWARATRIAYNAGILFLLAAITVLLAPPKHHSMVSLRGLAMLLAFIGFLAEITWVIASELLSTEFFHHWLNRRVLLTAAGAFYIGVPRIRRSRCRSSIGDMIAPQAPSGL
jgi:hypothetical protein